ncbi:MAG: 50S ribosomal protein L31 [Actinobacteria bacterium]|nr:50S ribosomal protein L31 [Actinomycetota bacterium]
MKKGIHPDYIESKVTCSCGETFITRSTRSELKIELCSKCHPFYTGKQKLVDSGGRVQRFQKKYGLEVTESETEKAEVNEEATR